MNKNFNSFRQMIGTTGHDGGFRSFEQWARSNFKQEVDEQEPVTENIKQEEPPQERVVEETIETPQEDVVSTLLQRLAETDSWEEPVRPNKRPETSIPNISEIEESINSLVEENERKRLEKQRAERARAERERIEREEMERASLNESVQEDSRSYKIFKDRDENFECQLSVEGASLTDAKVRIVLESDSWNFVFYGQVYGNGKCVVPIKRGIPLIEGAVGNIKLEVIADDQLFVGWEDSFKVSASKKVKVELKEQKSVKVSFNNSINEDRNT